MAEKTLCTVVVVLTVGREAPVHDGRLLHSPRVDPAGSADLLGNLDTVGLLDQSEMKQSLNIDRQSAEQTEETDFF